jgi:hypothetical protein
MKKRGRRKGWRKPDAMRSSMMVRLPDEVRDWLFKESTFHDVSESEIVRQVLGRRMMQKGHVKIVKMRL